MRSAAWAAALTVGYVAVAGSWIFVWSSLAATSSTSVEELARLETLKGVGYVIVTAVALYFSARYALRRIELRGQEVVHRERVLVANERRVFAGLIASSVAHDANNVLTAVLADLAELDGAADRDTLERLRASIDRLVQLNRRLVHAARQTASSTLCPLDLAEAVRDAMKLLHNHPSMRAARVAVTAADEGQRDRHAVAGVADRHQPRGQRRRGHRRPGRRRGHRQARWRERDRRGRRRRPGDPRGAALGDLRRAHHHQARRETASAYSR